MIRQGSYSSLIHGVSQQIPQERSDGQLGEQINMLSDAVTGLRRRVGTQFLADVEYVISSAPQFFEILEFGGSVWYIRIEPSTGNYTFYNVQNKYLKTGTLLYLQGSSNKVYRTVVSMGDLYIMNTDKIPYKQGYGHNNKDPKYYGYFSIVSSSFSRTFKITLKYEGVEYSAQVTTSATVADQATPAWVAHVLYQQFINKPEVAERFSFKLQGNTVSVTALDKATGKQLQVTSDNTSMYVLVSGASRVMSRNDLLGSLPDTLDEYIMGVGTLDNSAYYQYKYDTGVWSEVGEFQEPYTLMNMPLRVQYNDSALSITSLGYTMRKAGNDRNNPEPKFIDYGFTGIGTYQSRLVLLSGAYVYLSQTSDFTNYMRTTVTELLDTDPIEIANASTADAQYEYCIPYNKDLVLIAQNQQAVIPANSTVLTPKTAVIYPTTKNDVSLAASPKVTNRTLYYVYQRGTTSFQVAEFYPSEFSDTQYNAQTLTDHLPTYGTGVCTGIVVGSTDNIVLFLNGTNEIMVHQYLWQGDERKLLSFHKWKFPYKVLSAYVFGSELVFVLEAGLRYIIVGTAIKLEQIDKPRPYIDMYVRAEAHDIGTGYEIDVPTHLAWGNAPENLAVVQLDERTLEHTEVWFEYHEDTQTVSLKEGGHYYIGHRYGSSFTLTPPYIKDETGRVVVGEGSIVQSFKMTFKNTGNFQVQVQDVYGEVHDSSYGSALMWSEAELGHTRQNTVSTVTIPCRTRLSSTGCSLSTTGTLDLNVVNTEYILRIPNKHRRL